MSANEEQTPKPKQVRVPAPILLQLVDALRTADRDSSLNDRVLHDETRLMVKDALHAWERFQDERLRGGRS